MRWLWILGVCGAGTLGLFGCGAEPASTSTRGAKSGAGPQAAAEPEAGDAGASEGWKPIAPGVEARSFNWTDGPQISPVLALRVAPELLRVSVAAPGQVLDAPQWRAQGKYLAAVNGGFFDAQDRPLGVRLGRGKLLSKRSGTRWSIFRLKKIGGERVEAGIISARDWDAALGRGVRYSEAVQCGPRLVENGRVGSFKEQWGRRTGLGIAPNGRVVIAVADRDLSLRGWAECFARGLGCRDALNLDGGSSSQISLRAGNSRAEWSGGRRVPDAILIAAPGQDEE
jgi:exopolysaccharide biosynthesis protein